MIELIRFDNLEMVLNEYGKVIQDLYKRKLLEDDKKASGALVSSVRYIYQKEDNKYDVSLQLEDYWKYVEYGRKAGKFPPVNKILEWIRIKPVLPYPNKDGRLPTENQLAFLISRSIAENGIEAGNQLEKTVDEIKDEFTLRLIDALDKDLRNAIDLIWKE